MKKKQLLFFFSDETSHSCTSVVPTLARLANEIGIDFESYICERPESWSGKVLPLVGHNHLESFYYLANFYEEILYCSMTSRHSYQFRRAVLAFGGKVISTRDDQSVAEFYQDVFSFFGCSLPERVMILPDRPAKIEDLDLAPYAYMDVMHSNTLGISESTWRLQEKQFRDLGITGATALYCAPERADVLDPLLPGDTYASVTTRIAERNIQYAKQVGFLDPASLRRWQTCFCREQILALYELYEWQPFIRTVKKYADIVDNCDVIGSQIVYIPDKDEIAGNDQVISELADYNLIHNLIGVNPRIGFTIQKQHNLPLDWMNDPETPTPWDNEYSDEFLAEKLAQRATPVCFLFYAADLGHLPVITRILDMMSLDGMRGGISFPSTWFDYHPELLEQIYLPLEQGGVCPNLEPLVSSVGVSVATEAEGYIKPDFLAELIGRARRTIAEKVGERRVPRGYYPFQDANPRYQKDTGTPQYDVVSKLGFEYYITYKNSTQRGHIPYQKNGMTVMNKQTRVWFPGSGNPIQLLKQWEADCAQRRAQWQQDPTVDALDWITFGFDTPFFALSPNYLGEIEQYSFRNGWAKYASMHFIYEAIQYVRHTGGSDGNLFLVKPHELYRYVKMAQEQGLITPMEHD